jgi:hypothetical protein
LAERETVPTSDAKLILAERRIADLRAEDKARDAAGSEDDHDDLWDEIFSLDKMIYITVPTTLAGALVKLRRLADPGLGIEVGSTENDATCVRQVLAFLESAHAPPRK